MTEDHAAPRKPRVAVLFGGRSSEHAISCVTAGSVLAALDPGKYDVVPIGIARDGRWVLESGDVSRLAIQGPEDDRALGNVNLAGLADGRRDAAIGYWLAPDARGRGLATAAVSLLAEWGFDQLGLARIEFAILPENVASQRVAERVGANPEGIRERSHQAEGRAWDMTIWSLTR